MTMLEVISCRGFVQAPGNRTQGHGPSSLSLPHVPSHRLWMVAVIFTPFSWNSCFHLSSSDYVFTHLNQNLHNSPVTLASGPLYEEGN